MGVPSLHRTMVGHGKICPLAWEKMRDGSLGNCPWEGSNGKTAAGCYDNGALREAVEVPVWGVAGSGLQSSGGQVWHQYKTGTPKCIISSYDNYNYIFVITL